jgi:hypothetical protein
MEIIEFQTNCLAILYEMCQKFDLEAVFNLEKTTGEGSDREFVMNLSVWKFVFFVYTYFLCIVNICRLIAFFLAIGTGKTKQKSKIDAAYNMLVKVQKRNAKTIVNDKTREQFAAYGKW